MELYILRHGEASKRTSNASKDSERPLTIAGQGEVMEVANALDKLGVKFDFVATSPLKRARQTADAFAKIFNVKKGGLEEWAELKPGARTRELYLKLSQFKPESSVLVVGHEPYLSTMISEIIFDGGTGRIVLKKAGLAKITMTTFHPKIKGELRWLLTPKHLKKIAK